MRASGTDEAVILEVPPIKMVSSKALSEFIDDDEPEVTLPLSVTANETQKRSPPRTVVRKKSN